MSTKSYNESLQQRQALREKLAKKGLRKCVRCERIKLIKDFSSSLHQRAKERPCNRCNVEFQRRARQKLKKEVFSNYGNKCKRCGETDIDILTIDHTKQNGADHRRKLGTTDGSTVWKWLRANNYPKKEFRLLCYNCNMKMYKLFLRAEAKRKSA